MRQVPGEDKRHPYLIVGNGRLAHHFQHYFNYLKISHWHWWRDSTQSLHPLLEQSDKILVLIHDRAIEDFVLEHRNLTTKNKIWIHCSGLISTPFAESAHPLMPFTETLYKLDIYSRIPFITEQGRPQFPELFPELSNPHYAIPSQLKPLYHAWCVMSGNFTTILWQNFFDVLENQFEIPRMVSYPYLDQISYNLKYSSSPLTGPLTRNDISTIEKHLHSLKGNPFYQIYSAFVNTYNTLEHSESE